jgi:hypothetical protein
MEKTSNIPGCMAVRAVITQNVIPALRALSGFTRTFGMHAMRHIAWILLAVILLTPSMAQAAIQFRAATQDLGETSSLTASKPPGTTEGDLLIAFAIHDNNGACPCTPPAGQGWTAFSLPGTENNFTSRAWYKRVDASDAPRTDYTFTFAAAVNSAILYLAAFYEDSGIGNWTLEDGTGWAFDTGVNTISNGGVTAVDNSLFVVAYGNDDNEVVTTDPIGPTKIDEDMANGDALAAYYEMVDAIDGSVSYPITWGGVAEELSAMAGIFSWSGPRVLLIVGNGGSPSLSDQQLANYLTTNGLTVYYADDSDSVATYNSIISTNNITAVYVSGTSNAGNIGSKMTTLNVGVVNANSGNWSTSDLSQADEGQSNTDVNVVNTGHFITQPFAIGNLTIYNAGGENLSLGENIGPGGTELIRNVIGNRTALVAYDSGSQLYSGAPAPARRVGIFTDANFSFWTANAQTLVLRSILWAGSLAGSGGSTADLSLTKVVDSHTPDTMRCPPAIPMSATPPVWAHTTAAPVFGPSAIWPMVPTPL